MSDLPEPGETKALCEQIFALLREFKPTAAVMILTTVMLALMAEGDDDPEEIHDAVLDLLRRFALRL